MNTPVVCVHTCCTSEHYYVLHSTYTSSTSAHKIPVHFILQEEATSARRLYLRVRAPVLQTMAPLAPLFPAPSRQISLSN